MNKVTGRAKKYDGTAIDYVSIFNWSDGKCIAQVKPDSAGNWSYDYHQDINIGITYVAYGCEPIIHGPYYYSYDSGIPSGYVLSYDFNGNTLDSSPNALNGIKTGDAIFTEGRKAGTQAISFNSGCVQTPQAVPINSDKITISFWMSTIQTNLSFLYEFSENYSNNVLAPVLFLNNYEGNNVASSIRGDLKTSSYNVTKSTVKLDGSFQHIIVEIDTSKQGGQEQSIYVDNVLTSQYNQGADYNNSGNIGNNVLYIGQRNASVFSYRGLIQDFRVYNRVLSASERTALFNE